LSTAIAQLKENISVKVLEKELEGNDIITIRGGTEFSCDMFNRLFPGEWFDAWLLLAGMKMADKPSFVRYGYSIPLGNVKSSRSKSSRSKSKKKRVPTSLSGWRKKIESFKKEAQDENGASVLLVYFCPLSLNDNHFTLLEINEQDEKIYHYDSIADEGVINGTLKSTGVHKLVQVSYV
jgi:hypothetical protein